MRTGGRWFDPWPCQYSFRALMIVIATGFIPLSPLPIVSTIVMWKSSQWHCVEYWFKELWESMDRCTDHTQILLKTCLTASNQSVNEASSIINHGTTLKQFKLSVECISQM